MADKSNRTYEKWKWLLPWLSFKRRTLIINNLVASSLWHRLACVDPPVGLLPKTVSCFGTFCIESLKVICFWLKKIEARVHLASRCANHLQKFMLGSERLVWTPVAQCILCSISGLSLDNVLFLMYSKKFDFRGVPAFYRSLFKNMESV